MIELKTEADLALMRRAGLVVARTLAMLRDAIRPGLSTADLDVLADREIRAAGAVPSFLGYQGFPASICTSVNEVVVHGIPRPDVVLRDGDIVSVDCGAILAGWHGDAAITVPVGAVTPAVAGLLQVTEGALWAGLGAARAGGRLSDISVAVESRVKAARGRYAVVRDYAGHGIGTQMHQDPAVPNYGRAGRGPRLVPGLVLAVEPMIALGRRHTRELADGWTVVTRDGQPAAHFEHTIAITEAGPWVLTALDGGRSRLAAGVTAAG